VVHGVHNDLDDGGVCSVYYVLGDFDVGDVLYGLEDYNVHGVFYGLDECDAMMTKTSVESMIALIMCL
jgi:hypothetical protein